MNVDKSGESGRNADGLRWMKVDENIRGATSISDAFISICNNNFENRIKLLWF